MKYSLKDVLSLDGAPLTAQFPTAEECSTSYYRWICLQNRNDDTDSFALFMSAKMGELYVRLSEGETKCQIE